MLKKTVKRYAFFISMLALTIVVTIFDWDAGLNAGSIAFSSFEQMLSVLPAVMVLIGLMDVWVSKETMMRYMGEGSGLLGIALAILIGSLAAGPMYAAFPFTVVLLRKGVKFSNIIIFMNAWCVTKVSTLMFEIAALGYKFTLIRLSVNIPGIIIMGYLVQMLIPKHDLDKVYLNAENIE